MENGRERKVEQLSKAELTQVRGGHGMIDVGSPAKWYYVNTNRPLTENEIVSLASAKDAGFEFEPAN